jgi:hypothetical protein
VITQNYLKECVSYNEETGIFVWNERPLSHFKSFGDQKTWNKRWAGKICGTRLKAANKFYRQMTISSKWYTLHRLAFLYVKGFFPSHEVDHINGNGEDNSFNNLREVSRLENNRNLSLKKSNTTGICGVSFDKRLNKYRAYINLNYKQISLGYFDDISKAIDARKNANLIYGYHENHGRLNPN